jgi:methyl-accepting chemotaxis protein
VAVVAFSSWKAFEVRNALVDAHKQNIKNMVEAATDVVQSLYQRAQKGELDAAAAQTMARNFIRSMHCAGREYLFVYDDKATNIADGSKPEREGQNFLNLKDVNRYAFFPDMISLAKGGGGFVHYWLRSRRRTAHTPRSLTLGISNLGTGLSELAST